MWAVASTPACPFPQGHPSMASLRVSQWPGAAVQPDLEVQPDRQVALAVPQAQGSPSLAVLWATPHSGWALLSPRVSTTSNTQSLSLLWRGWLGEERAPP